MEFDKDGTQSLDLIEYTIYTASKIKRENNLNKKMEVKKNE